jgi:hypothetical protein
MLQGHLVYLFVSYINYIDNSKTINCEPILITEYISVGHYNAILRGKVKTVRTVNILTQEELELEGMKGTKICAKNLDYFYY